MRKFSMYVLGGFLLGIGVFYGFQFLFRSDTPWLGFIFAFIILAALIIALPKEKKK